MSGVCGADHGRGFNQTTASGLPFFVLDPTPEDVRITDIAEQLSRICRFNGALRHDVAHYSVAQHCCLVSDHLPPSLRLEGLLHDAQEAYVGDMIQPLKQNLKALGFDWDRLEGPVERAVRERFGLPPDMSPEVKHQDWVAVYSEHLQLQAPNRGVDWGTNLPEPWPEPIEPWTPHEARMEFLMRFHQLYHGR